MENCQRAMLIVSYDGSDFYGFERQIGKKTIQGEIEAAIKKAIGQDITITPSGRTDAGVHALGQACHFDFFGDFKIEKLQSALNFYLPQSIRILSALSAENDFSARSAKKKTYFYDLYVSDVDNPLLINRAWRVKNPLNEQLMLKAMELFVGCHDFENFRCAGSSAKTTVRNIYSFDLNKIDVMGENVFRFSICADGFLYKMVRLIVGAVVMVSEGKISIEELSSYINKTAVIKTKLPAPACGLYLKSVEY